MDELPRSGYSNPRVHQVNATPSGRPGSSLRSEIALAAGRLLAAICALEVALPRAGRAAAGFLLRTDSAALSWLEGAGGAVQRTVANAVLVCALLACAAGAAEALATRRPSRIATAVAIFLLACWIFARRGDPDAALFWWPALASPFVAGAAILLGSRSAIALGAAALQAGLAAYAAWALVVTTGPGARPALDQSSEALVFGGIALAGVASWTRGSRRRTALAAAAFGGACSVAAAFPGASHAVARHLVSAGSSGLPFAATAALLAASLAGLVIATGTRGLAPALLIALVCARRPEPAFILGTLASSLLLASRPWIGRREPPGPR
jgi:hypothetical protein